MEDTLLCFCNSITNKVGANGVFPKSHFLPLSISPNNNNKTLLTHCTILSSSSSPSSSKTTTTITTRMPVLLPQKPFETPNFPPQQPPPPPETDPLINSSSSSDPNGFGDKIIYLESIGIDLFSLIEDYPLILTSSLHDMKSTIDFMRSLGFTTLELRRICGMCPEILTYKISDIVPVFTFLFREVKVTGSYLRRVINRRPRLLACDVATRLRPTLYFLQSIGISEVHKYTSLLSCSVEDKFIPRIHYFEKIGFSSKDAISMVRRFPQLFCYSIRHNFEPKFEYFVVEMGRKELSELKEFPHYFSFSLENRIKPRHRICVENGVWIPLPVMLKTSDTQFYQTLEVCRSSSPPLKTSPLWCITSNSIKNNINSISS